MLTCIQNIILLWEGSITGLDEALQLVLIVDYILDWARDIFRLSILRQLKCVATKGAYSTYTVSNDPDVLSMQNAIPNWLDLQGRQTSVPASITAGSAIDNGRSGNDLDLIADRLLQIPLHEDENGLVVCGTVLRSKVRGLCITVDNLSTILQGFSEDPAKHEFVSTIFKITETRARCFVLPDTRALQDVEQVWTGNATYSTTLSTTLRSTLVSMEVNFYTKPDHQLVRELTYLAITMEAYEELTTSYYRSKRASLGRWKTISSDRILTFVESEDKTIKDDFLLRCLENQAFVSHHSPKMHFRRDARLKSRAGRVTQLVRDIYHTYRIGLREPTESFIRNFDVTENIAPKPEHPIWSAHTGGVLAKTSEYGKFILYVANKRLFGVSTSWLVKNLASRMSPEAQIFDCSQPKGSCWTATDDKTLSRIARWIVSQRLARDQLVEMRGAFPDAGIFQKLLQFKDEGFNRWNDWRFSWR